MREEKKKKKKKKKKHQHQKKNPGKYDMGVIKAVEGEMSVYILASSVCFAGNQSPLPRLIDYKGILSVVEYAITEDNDSIPAIRISYVGGTNKYVG